MRAKRNDSLAARLVGFLTQNPDENLSLPDVVAKFGGSKEYAEIVVRQLERDHQVVIERVVRRPRA